jgi:regulator of replication initiation timing
MDEPEFNKLLSKITEWKKYSKKRYKYNTKDIEDKINQLRQDLHDLVEVLGCFADGYTILKQELEHIKEVIGI